MREGLQFLWLTSLILSLLAWLIQKRYRYFAGRLRNRRQITGCELARQVLDRTQGNRIAVASGQGPERGHGGFSMTRLELPERIYYGTRLRDTAQALHETAHQLEAPRSLVPAGFRAPSGGVFQVLVCVAWILIPAGILVPEWEVLRVVGKLFFLFGFGLALVSLPLEGAVTGRALVNLPSLEGFGPDEKIRMRKILKTLKWSSFSEMIEAPWKILVKGVAIGLSRPARVH